MNNNEWYEGAGWYAPLEEARPTEKPSVKPEPQEEKEKPRGLTALRVSGGILILLALIVSSSLIFATPTSAPPSVKASLPVSLPTPSPSASASLPIDPNLAALCDKGMIELMKDSQEKYVAPAADAIERKCADSGD